jgi:hypothetical protein
MGSQSEFDLLHLVLAPFFAISLRFSGSSVLARAGPPAFPALAARACAGDLRGVSSISPVAIFATMMAAPITSAGRRSPLGPRGIVDSPVAGCTEILWRRPRKRTFCSISSLFLASSTKEFRRHGLSCRRPAVPIQSSPIGCCGRGGHLILHLDVCLTPNKLPVGRPYFRPGYFAVHSIKAIFGHVLDRVAISAEGLAVEDDAVGIDQYGQKSIGAARMGHAK